MVVMMVVMMVVGVCRTYSYERGATERRRAWTRRIEISRNENFSCSDQHRSCEKHCIFWDGGQGEPTGNECQLEHVRGSGLRELNR